MAALGLLAAAAAHAHSLKELEDQLAARDRYFQAIDRPAAPFALRDADGRTVRLDELKNTVVVLHFIYASCPDVCPLHAEKIAAVQRMVNHTPMKELVRFVTVTTDPANDGPEVMRAYGPLRGLDPANWSFLTSAPGAPEDSTRRLAAAYGHKFTQSADGYQMHGIVTHVIDREGRWRANFHGLKFEPVSLVMFVNALVNDVHRPAATPE